MSKIKLLIDDVVVFEQNDTTTPPPVTNPPPTTTNPANTAALAIEMQKAIDNGTMLNVQGGEYIVTSPILINITKTTQGPMGFNGNGVKFISQLNNNQNVIEYRLTNPGIDFRYLKLQDFSIAGNGSEGNGLVITCPLNDSWIYNAILRDVSVEHVGGQAGILLNGSVFESKLDNVWTHGNKNHGLVMQHDPAGGQVSAMTVTGGGHRKNGKAGMALFNGARDIKQYGVYYVENVGVGLLADQGFTGIWGCGFENNGGTGVWFQNFGNLWGCTGSSNGVQTSLVEGYLAGGNLLLESCGVEGYSGFEGQMMLARINAGNPQTVMLINSGDANSVQASGHTAVRVI